MLVDSKNNKWFASWEKGLSKYNDSTWTTYDTLNSGLPSQYIHAMAEDKEGNIWIATGDKGVCKFDGATWTKYDTLNSGLPGNIVLAAVADDKGNMWFGFYQGHSTITYKNGSVAKFDGKTWTVYNSNNSPIPTSSIGNIAIDKEGNKWFGTYKDGLIKLEEGTSSIGNINKTEVLQVYPNPSSDKVYVANKGYTNINIYDITGRLVHAQAIQSKPAGEIELSLAALAPGAYIIKAATANNSLHSSRIMLAK